MTLSCIGFGPSSHLNQCFTYSLPSLWKHQHVQNVLSDFRARPAGMIQHCQFTALKAKASQVVDAPEILTVIGSIPNLSPFLNSFYSCEYHKFFQVWALVPSFRCLPSYPTTSCACVMRRASPF